MIISADQVLACKLIFACEHTFSSVIQT